MCVQNCCMSKLILGHFCHSRVQVITQQKLPKELLQSSLRPILVNLANYKNLSMPLLQGLARLLELLSSWFNVTLGDKLKDHLRKWLEPEQLSQPQPAKWKPGEEPKIAAGGGISAQVWFLHRQSKSHKC